MNYLEIFKSGSGIHIKEKNRGKFTKSAKAAGEGVQEHAHKVMNDPNATTLQKRRANFAIQAKKWHRKHQDGGNIYYDSASLDEVNKSLNIPELEIPDYVSIYKAGNYKPTTTKKQEVYKGITWDDILLNTIKYPISISYKKTGVLADRNNNPLNLRSTSDVWKGLIGSSNGFVSFKDMAHGYRAGFKNIINQIKKGNNTLKSLLSVWAPASDGNNPTNYAKFVSEKTGININDTLNPNNKEQMIKLASAMYNMESGHEANIADIESGWDLFLKG